MQAVSDAYIESMREPFRNRGYIKGSIGIINSEAQNNAVADDKNNNFTYFSNAKKPFTSYSVSQLYATTEQDFSKLDGSMYFLPKEDSGLTFYNNGMVTEDLLGAIRISFGEYDSLDIKGMTINFGDCYPSELTITNGKVSYDYTNNNKLFVTEDVFDDTSYIVIQPKKMVNGQGRLRIYKIEFGVVDSFGNDELISCSINEFVSSTAETLPSKDVEIILDNQNSYYDVDNESSAIGYLELGQEVKISFGYDVTGNDDIEWLPEMLTYLKSWSASDAQVQFICTDLFDNMEGIYYRGLYRQDGISLYDLAVDVFSDAGYSSDQYYIDGYLKNIMVYNPMPAVKHSEALQIIANAGRCALYDDRDGRIHLQASFIPDMTATSNGETVYSKISNVLIDSKKTAYAVTSNDFSVLDGSVLFMPEDKQEYADNTGYVSNQCADENGDFEETPVITINLESGFVAYGLKIDFRSVIPQEFKVTTYYNGVKVEQITEKPTGVHFDTQRRFEMFDKMEIEFFKGYPNSRVFIDNIKVGDVTNYHLKRDFLLESPTATRQDKIKSISIIRNIYSESTEEKDLAQEDVDLSVGNTTHIVYFNDASYGLSATVEENQTIKATITESSNYYAVISFSGVTKDVTVKLKVTGREYSVEENPYSVNHNKNGTDMEWNNPLISTIQQARDLEEWLAEYYLGRVEYEFNWRGDPRTDANDLFYFELKDGREQMIRAYENSLSFRGAWSGKIKSRAVVI